jgi:hypothetical protein
MKNLNSLLSFILLSLLLSNCGKDETVTPFNIYSSLINQSDENIPTENVLVNNLGITITWTREDVGTYKGVLSKPVDLNKTTLIIQLQENDRIATGGFIDSNTIVFSSADRYNLYDARDGFSHGVIEIKTFNTAIVKQPTRIP